MLEKSELNHFCCENTHPEWVFSSLGSLIMVCPQCGRDHFREGVGILHFSKQEYCVWCGDVELSPIPANPLDISEK